jgi:hypothetical protein
VPGHHLVSDPLDAASTVADFPGFLLDLGQWIAGTVAIVLVFLALARIGVGRWSAWDACERAAARLRVPVRPSRRVPMLKMLALATICVAMCVGTFALLWR